jgi:predicted nucleic acid-binding Zn ribbon protein
MADSNGPENLAEVLSRLFTSRGWGRRTERVRLEETWAAVVGPAVLAETRVGGLRRGVLEVEVRTGVLMQELAQFHKRPLLAKLRQALPGTTITDLKFRAGAW